MAASVGAGILRFRQYDILSKEELFNQQYPQLQDQLGFSFRPGTSMEFHLPYAPETERDQAVADERHLRSKTFYLNLSLYPERKLIEIQPE